MAHCPDYDIICCDYLTEAKRSIHLDLGNNRYIIHYYRFKLMPAQKKYLSSGWVRFSKLMASIPGAFISSILLHLAIAQLFKEPSIIIFTATYTVFLLWCGLMILVYMVRKAWISWMVLLSIVSLSSLLLFI